MNDVISRQDVMHALEKCHKQCCRKDDGGDEWIHYETTENEMECIPSAEPEIKPIDYRDCANAMLKMWMDDVVTDGEYYRIMDKLNKHELERRNNG